MSTQRFDAFISYSHAADSRLAEALEAALQRFAKPLFKRRGMRVFRDQSELSLAPHLWGKIETALGGSGHFLLLASPGSAASPWVAKELEHWKARRGAETIFIIQTDGELHWDEGGGDYDWERTTCLPSVLKGVFAGEPLYLDMRWTRHQQDLSLRHEPFKRAVAQIIAAIRGQPVEDVYGEELRRHRRTIRLRDGAIALLSVLTLASLIAAGVAVQQRRVANAQRQRAERSAEEERLARQATEQQLAFIGQVLEDQLDMRDQEGIGSRTFPVLRIYFDFDQVATPDRARAALDRLADFLRGHPEVRVLVAGHFAQFDESGESTDEYAMALSERRAAGVRSYLQSRGVAAQRIQVLAQGRERPLIRATNPEERVDAMVRRINSRAEVYLRVR